MVDLVETSTSAKTETATIQRTQERAFSNQTSTTINMKSTSSTQRRIHWNRTSAPSTCPSTDPPTAARTHSTASKSTKVNNTPCKPPNNWIGSMAATGTPSILPRFIRKRRRPSGHHRMRKGWRLITQTRRTGPPGFSPASCTGPPTLRGIRSSSRAPRARRIRTLWS